MLDHGDNTDPRFWLGEPIWISAEKDGVPAATMFWTGSEVDYDGWHPSIRVPYDGGIPYGDRIERVMGWLAMPEPARPRMITLYFDEPDGAGHAVGASGEAVDRAVEDMDTTVGFLVQALDQSGWLDRVHLIIVSDHGMADTGPERLVFLDDHVDLDGVYADNWGPWVPLRPPAGTAEDFAAQLTEVPHATCARAEDLPERLHYVGSDRIAPVHCIAEAGWSITTREWHAQYPHWHDGGTHGYDPADPEMHGILIARGPLLRRGATVPSIENVHLYGLMAHILGVPAAPNDGDEAVWSALLAE
jgi:predicted AlkP superfamily pyrophosphatase or phosphodiesterase